MADVIRFADVICGECGAIMKLRRSRAYGRFYGCSRFPECTATHGAHQATGQPLGTPADKPTREARQRAHAAFDHLWQSGVMRRKDAYRWMQDALGLTKKKAHISMMDIATCERLLAAVAAFNAALRREGGAA
jgi:ssDNA-binding Zn-finger/Zn-ribbon topoisomerase 1